jgi:hypothetical protein
MSDVTSRDAVGCLPWCTALLRLAGSVLVEAHDKWQVADKRYLSKTSLLQTALVFAPGMNISAGPFSRYHGVRWQPCRLG